MMSQVEHWSKSWL